MLPDLQIVNSVIDFGKVRVGNLKDTLKAVTITNNGKTPIEIKRTNHNKPNEIEFTTLGGAGPFILNTGDTAKLDLRFKPSARQNKRSTRISFRGHWQSCCCPACR